MPCHADVKQFTTMYEFANSSSTPANGRDAEDHQTAALALDLGHDVTLRHHQTFVVNSTTAQTGVHGRGGVDLSINGHHDHHSLTSSTSSSAAAPLLRHHHPVDSDSTTTLQEPLEYVSGLRANELFRGANIHL